MKRIAQGAEAVIRSDGSVVAKQRIEKTYRHPFIDERLRKFRTRREAKVLSKLSEIGFPGPKLHDFSDKEMDITMQHIQGPLLKEVLLMDHLKLSREIGERIALLHNHDIIHGDLTTSNMILEEKSGKINFIDFGLSFFSAKEEDKAVDLHLLKQALESKHYEVFEGCFSEVLKAYSRNYPGSKLVLDRLEKVEMRGRNKGKGR